MNFSVNFSLCLDMGVVYSPDMNARTYMIIIRCFMVSMPVMLLWLVRFIRVSRKTGQTQNPVYEWALICSGILAGEIVRGWLILRGILPPHPKNVYVWLAQLVPFGGLFYAILARQFRKIWNRSHANND